VFCVVFSCSLNFLLLAAPIYMTQVYDRVLSSNNLYTLAMLTVAVGLAYLSQSALDAVRSRLMTRAGNAFEHSLRRAVFQAELAEAADRRSGGVGQGARDMEQVRAFLTGAPTMALMDAPWTPLFILVLALIHPLLAALTVGGMVALIVLALINEALVAGQTREANIAAAEAQSFFDSALRNAYAVKAMGMADALTARWSARRDEAACRQTAALDRGGVVSAVVKFVRLLLQSLILGLGAWLVIGQQMSAGSIFAAVFLLARALAPVEILVASWRSVVTARQAWRRLKELLNRHRPGEDAMPQPAPQGALSAAQLGWIPAGADRPVLRGVDIDLAPGEALGVIGPSGAGKSTLLRLLAGVHAPSAGTVRLDGAELRAWNRAQLGALIGYLPQDVDLFTGTIRDNIARFQDASPETVVAAAQAAGCHEMIMALPKSYDTPVGEGGAILSGGQRQRVGLARALFGGPQILILDEPNAHLDAAGEERLMETLATLKRRGVTLVLSAQRPRLLEAVDRILVLRNGAPELLGERAALLARLMRPVPPADAPANVTQIGGGAVVPFNKGGGV
jgi:ATP-binding cassette, subfamily C, bacterial